MAFLQFGRGSGTLEEVNRSTEIPRFQASDQSGAYSANLSAEQRLAARFATNRGGGRCLLVDRLPSLPRGFLDFCACRES